MTVLGTLAQQRLPEVTAHIDGDYRKLATGVDLYQHLHKGSYKRDYDFRGVSQLYNWSRLGLTSEEVLENDGLSVLDLGCGAGQIVRDYNARNPAANRAHGITANPYMQTDPAIIVGNVHYLDDIYPAELGPVDVGISKLMYMHLADPLSVLAMMAGHIKKGGLMVTDGFSIRTQIGSLLASYVMSYLTRSGHFDLVGKAASGIRRDYIDSPSMFTGQTNNYIPSMLLERKSPTESVVELPVTYGINPYTGNWLYLAA